MNTLALKLTVTPVLMLAVSLASRRWGESIGGWFVGLPLTSGPVCFFLALDDGPEFAAAAGLGCLAGAAAEAGFCIGYGRIASHAGWLLALSAGSVGYVVCGFVFTRAALPLWPLAATACAALAAALYLIPRGGRGDTALARSPRWEIPARMSVATALVLGLTALAPFAGPRLSGLLATYPVFAAVLAVFGQHRGGPASAIQVLRGLLTGLFAYTGFFAALVVSLPSLGIAAGFALSTGVALAIQATTLRLLRRA
jgi:hypothetical protein